MERRRVLLTVLGMALLLAACSAGVNQAVDVPGPDKEIAGFWTGIWHGIIAPITFLISLFSDNVNVYEVHNSGNWYDFGFVAGFMLIPGGSHSARS